MNPRTQRVDAGLSSSFFLSSVCDPSYSSSCVREQTPAGRLLLSQMSGMHGKMRLVLSSQEAGQANCAVPQIHRRGQDAAADREALWNRQQGTKTRIFGFCPTFVAAILMCTGELSQEQTRHDLIPESPEERAARCLSGLSAAAP